MTTILKIGFLLLISLEVFGQSQSFKAYQDSLRTVFITSSDVLTKINSGAELAAKYIYSYPDSTIFYGQQVFNLAKENKLLDEQIWTMAIVGEAYMNKANLPKALELGLEALDITRDIQNEQIFLGPTYSNLSELYFQIGDLKKARMYALASINDPRLVEEKHNEAYGYFLFSQVLEKEQKPDSAMQMLERSFEQFTIQKDNFFRKVYGENAWPGLYNLRAKINLQFNKPEEALKDLNKIMTASRISDEPFHSANAFNDIALFYQKYNQPDSSIHYALKALEESKKLSYDRAKVLSLDILSEEFESKDPVKSLYYFKLANEVRNRLFGSGNVQILREMVENHEKRVEVIASAKKESQNNLRMYLLGFGFLAALFFAYILFRNNKSKIKANEELQSQKLEIESTLSQLKSTQAQLIQSEKMASLGELTAGIAHEIQNPLNFVNNFSEVSRELIDEMKEEFKKGDTEEGFAIADDLKNNLEKINDHGQRASSIVKGMLEHSRTSTGQKELTDINALCDEYLRLAYHGLKAKNKDFNATMETNFDPNLPKIEVIPQDIGRVLLNLINNAFYACTERLALSNAEVSRSAVNERSKDIERAGSPSGVGGKGGQGQVHKYDPTVSITTQLTTNSQQPTANSQLLISIKDNGSGIPDAIKDKIFQPFFTTKPTGKGTGLGLSLAYDIVKGHGGELRVESAEGEGSTFFINLPLIA